MAIAASSFVALAALSLGGSAKAQSPTPSDTGQPTLEMLEKSREHMARTLDVEKDALDAPDAPGVSDMDDKPAPKQPAEPTARPKPLATKPEVESAVTVQPEAKPAVTESAVNAIVAKPALPVATRLVVSSWAGAYGDAQDSAIIAPVARRLGIEIERRVHEGADATIGEVDATELDQSSLVAACASGKIIRMQTLLSRQELSGTAGGSTDSGSDFLANSVTDCGVPTFAWSSMLMVNGEAMQKLAKRRYRAPSRLADLLDPKEYPGKRALIRSPKRLLEMMLLGSGTKGSDVYSALATRRGQDAAFEALNELSDHILWVDGPREALLAIDQGNATIAMTYSGRAFRRLIASRLMPIWDGHIIDYASWAVPATSKNREKAKRFILAATSAQSLAAQARLWPYGPMRRSAVALAKRHELTDAELEGFMPTSDVRFSQGLVFNAAFWAKHGAVLQDRFDAWQNGVPLGVRVPPPSRAPPPPPPVLPPLPER